MSVVAPASAGQPAAGQPAATATTTAAPAKKGKKLRLLAVAVVVLGAGGFVAKGKFLKPHYRPGQVAPNGQVDTLDQLTVNLADGHLVQATIALQLTTVANAKAIAADQPRFEDAAISVLGAQTYAGLIASGGRDAVKATLLQRFQQITGPVDGSPQVSAVYYTGFVIQ